MDANASKISARVDSVIGPSYPRIPRSKVTRKRDSKLKLSLNAYSFDKPLRAGTMTLEDASISARSTASKRCAGHCFPGYPQVPSDESIYKLKRTAFLNGVALRGTGVRNDFTVPDAASRKRDVEVTKDWIEVVAKLGRSGDSRLREEIGTAGPHLRPGARMDDPRLPGMRRARPAPRRDRKAAEPRFSEDGGRNHWRH